MTKTAEIVTFRLAEGTDTQAFLAAAQAMTPFLQSTGAYLGRALSVDQDGLWTDHITWTDHSAALAAAEQMMTRPEGGAFMAHIDPGSVTMRHAAVQME
ncbi:MAG: hypothetical protein AAF218_10010 [Pseudomonadota bacterium]